jgi:tRNA pseudouridine32 synthase/23S rRNA pseudouridine746 synthase
MTISIVFTHQDFIVVNKPANINVHSEDGNPGIVPILCEQLKVPKLWLVHRLDKVTSGLLILAKNTQAAASFGSLFSTHKIQKYYLAIASAKPKKKQGAIIGDMHKARDKKWALSPQITNPAITQFFSQSLVPGLRLFILKPHTGKTHQLRVAMKSLGSPILGDTLYKGDTSDRAYLHAYKLAFSYQSEAISLRCLPEQGEHFAQSGASKAFKIYTNPTELAWPRLKK